MESLNRVRDRSEAWDIVIIGGGATGAGCALDAASRGYAVLLLEQHDFGKGTSSRSTKLIHGGVRYLRQGNVRLVREALRERSILLRNAPHVIHRLPFVIPCYSLWEKVFYGAGMMIYEAFAGKSGIGISKLLSRLETQEELPNINRRGLKGGVLYYDAQFDDTRLLIDILRTARSHGAAILNYAKVTALEKDRGGRISGVSFIDVETETQYSVHARVVINAAGVFSDEVRSLDNVGRTRNLAFSQGTHLVFDRSFLPGGSALIIPKTSDGRVVFCVPWLGRLLVGTTETPVDTPTLEPQALETEINFILETAGHYLAPKPTRKDILSVFAGIRPLVANGSHKGTSRLSRSHDLIVDENHLVTITGGKWTTYRRMAEHAVNKAAEIGALRPSECVTARLGIQQPEGIDGDSAHLHAAFPYTRSDILRAIRNEMAMTVEDVLARRTRALFLDAKAAIEIAPEVLEMLRRERGKDEHWARSELDKFNRVAAGYLPTAIREK